MRKKITLTFVAAIAMISALVPLGAGARPVAKARSACVVVNGPGGFHLQVGYSPTGPDSCKHL